MCIAGVVCSLHTCPPCLSWTIKKWRLRLQSHQAPGARLWGSIVSLIASLRLHHLYFRRPRKVRSCICTGFHSWQRSPVQSSGTPLCHLPLGHAETGQEDGSDTCQPHHSPVWPSLSWARSAFCFLPSVLLSHLTAPSPRPPLTVLLPQELRLTSWVISLSANQSTSGGLAGPPIAAPTLMAVD